MADKKISQLTAATIPLAGTEPVPLVQSGNTVKATAQNIANLAIPTQTGQSGKYLTTNGSVASWDAIDISTADVTGTLPIANGGTGQTSASSAINALLPSQTGENGKYLTTNGTTASWSPISQVPSQAGQAGKFLTTNGTTASWAAAGAPAFQTSFLVVSCSGGVASVFLINSAYNITYTATINGGNIWINPIDPAGYTLQGAVCSPTNTPTFSATYFPIQLGYDGAGIAKIAVRDASGVAQNMNTTDITWFYCTLYYNGF
jgi:hypothetical protein